MIGLHTLAPLLGLGTAALAPPPAAATPIDDVRVMTFNIRYGTAPDGQNSWPDRRHLVFEVIRDFGPAVLGVQEALDFQVDELLSALPGYEVIGVGRDDGVRAGEFAAILIDSELLQVAASGTFWFSDAPEAPGSMSWGNRIPRICTWARLVDRSSGRAFYIYNVHWDHESQPSRERSAELLLARIAGRAFPDDPVLVLGDFNAGEANPAFLRLIAADEIGLRDTFRALHPHAADVGTFNGFDGRGDGEKIDAILASPAWCVRRADIVRTSGAGRWPSDHFPVVAELALPDAGDCTAGASRTPATALHERGPRARGASRRSIAQSEPTERIP